MKNSLQMEYDFYQSHKDQIKEKYNNQYVAIKDCEIKHHGQKKEEVIRHMLNKNYKLGEFLVHLVSDNSDIIQRYYSRVLN